MPLSTNFLILTSLSCLIASTGAGPCKPHTDFLESTTEALGTTSALQQISVATTLIEASTASTTAVSDQTIQTSDASTVTTSDITSTTASEEPEPTSLLKNGGFDSLPLTLEPWEKYLVFGDQADVSISNEVFRDGRASVHMKVRDEARRTLDPQYIIQKLDENKISPGITYQLTAWFRSNGKAQAPGQLDCSVAFLQGIYATNKYVARKTHTLNKQRPDEWETFSIQLSWTEEQFAQGNLYVWVGLGCDRAGEGYIDSASLEIVPIDDAPTTTDEVSATTSTTIRNGDPTE